MLGYNLKDILFFLFLATSVAVFINNAAGLEIDFLTRIEVAAVGPAYLEEDDDDYYDDSTASGAVTPECASRKKVFSEQKLVIVQALRNARSAKNQAKIDELNARMEQVNRNQERACSN